MRILIFGLPGSGKTTLGLELIKHFSCLYLNGDKVRETFGDRDFSMQGRISQARRMRDLADQATQAMVIADFVCPTHQAREIFDADFCIWMNTIDHGRYEDTNKIFEPPIRADYIVTSQDAGRHVKQILERLKIHA